MLATHLSAKRNQANALICSNWLEEKQVHSVMDFLSQWLDKDTCPPITGSPQGCPKAQCWGPISLQCTITYIGPLICSHGLLYHCWPSTWCYLSHQITSKVTNASGFATSQLNSYDTFQLPLSSGSQQSQSTLFSNKLPFAIRSRASLFTYKNLFRTYLFWEHFLS